MKKIRFILTLAIVCLFFSLSGFGQENLLYESVQQAKADGTEFQEIQSAFQQAPDDRKTLAHFENPGEVQFILYDETAFRNLTEAVFLAIPFKDREIQLELLEVPASFYGYDVVTSDGQHLPASVGAIRHYQGVVRGDLNSVVAMSFTEEEVMGIVATDEGNFNLSLDRENGRHVFFNDKNLKEKLDFNCGVTHDHDHSESDTEFFSETSKSEILSSTARCTRIYLETEHDIFQARGSVLSVEIFVTGLFNQVAVLYRNENVEIRISEIFVWTTADPYAATHPLTLLGEFQTHRTAFNGDLGQLLTFRGSLGGWAARINGLCHATASERLSVSMFDNNFAPVPTFSKTVFVVAHELGHLFGSHHTHACAWNENNTAIDGCANAEDVGFGPCLTPGIPSGGGTIMSYCVDQSVGVNFNLGFGTQPGNRIRNRVANATCLCVCGASTMSGPASLCTTSGTYSINNVPAGATVTWSANPSSAVTITGSGNSRTVTRAGSFNGEVILTATVTVPGCGAFPLRRVLNVGFVNVNAFSLQGFGGVLTPNTWILSTIHLSGVAPTAYRYRVTGPSGFQIPWTNLSNRNFTFTVPFVGNYTIFGQGQSGCGWGTEYAQNFTVVSGLGGMLVYPNPADHTLVLSYVMEGQGLAEKKFFPEFSATLYDDKGNQCVSGNSEDGQIIFDTEAFPAGTYFVHILHNGKEERKQVLIRH
ncbi:M12 family metallo-peptidase [Lunatimonas salinarum]|uniref:M12 family metallo-peptidase n=1 Tax=Lunatimonas salinarum TaxID=1774590 RepID=UPI001ADF5E7C|nr:M12 family metallo-peptidase [Lunatimonas salinarum]